MSKFLFHLKFSQKENYVHEHELYEVMRSRNLYQVQFEVRSNYKKKMRNIQISEKARVNGFQNSRNIFIQKMKERMERADKTRKVTTKLAEKSFAKLFPKDNTIVRRYAADFPNVIEKLVTPTEPLPNITPTTVSSARKSRLGTGTSRRTSCSFLSNAPESPSMAATIYVDNSSATPNEKKRETYEDKSNILAKVVVAGKNGQNTVYREKKMEDESFKNTAPVRGDKTDTSLRKMSSKIIDLDLTAIQENVRKKKHSEANVFSTVSKTEAGWSKHISQNAWDPQIKRDEISNCDDQLDACVHFSDHLTTTENIESETASQKVVEWATAHKLLSKESEEEKTFRRLLIDRPSKWAFSHIHGPAINNSSTFETEDLIPNSERRKSKVVDFTYEKHPKSTLSLPVIESGRRKPLVCMEPGALTPDGRLILTQCDYDEYLSDYRRARNMRLSLSKKKFKTLTKLVDRFHISPKQQLKDETKLMIVQSEF